MLAFSLNAVCFEFHTQGRSEAALKTFWLFTVHFLISLFFFLFLMKSEPTDLGCMYGVQFLNW